ncbi:hypothetical protein JCM12178A_00780 [Salidesulfovibrio brasiliensis]
MMPLTTDPEPPNMGPPGRRQSVAALREFGESAGPVVLVNFRNFSISGYHVAAALEHFEAGDSPAVMAVKPSEDHPCQLFSHRRLIDVGYLTKVNFESGEASPALSGRVSDEEIFAAAADGSAYLSNAGAGKYRLHVSTLEAEPDEPFSLVLSFSGEDGGTESTGFDRYDADRPFALPDSAQKAPVLRYAVSGLGIEGEYSARKPYAFSNDLWEVDERTCQVRNRANGRVIRGRQDFPDVLELDDSLVVATPEAASGLDHLVGEGKVAAYRPEPPLGDKVCSELDYLKIKAAKRGVS